MVRLQDEKNQNLEVNLTAKELAKRWKMHPESVRRMGRQRRIETTMIGRRRLFPLAEIERIEQAGRISRAE